VAKEGYDLQVTVLGDDLLFTSGSEWGESLLKGNGFRPAETHHLDQFEQVVPRFRQHIKPQPRAWISRAIKRLTLGFVSEEVWQQVGNRCFECGGCNFVCPTCWCFNISDQCRGEEFCRVRTWDSCNLEGYSRMAGGHNPRAPVEDRRNRRLFCKLSYSNIDKFLRPGCVGCGRCVTVCWGSIDLPSVVTMIRHEYDGE
jgi:formate hydrogenlyase subunit 6/NADH:ubiquinone oxidoreductase subunit I